MEQANVFVDGSCTARIGDFGLAAMGNLGTNLFSETVGSSGGTFPWMSPELLKLVGPGSNVRPAPVSDCYALATVVYEVSQCSLRCHPVNPSQIFTGLQPFHDLTYCQFMYTVASGGQLKKPPAAGTLGFSDSHPSLSRSRIHCPEDDCQ